MRETGAPSQNNAESLLEKAHTNDSQKKLPGWHCYRSPSLYMGLSKTYPKPHDAVHSIMRLLPTPSNFIYTYTEKQALEFRRSRLHLPCNIYLPLSFSDAAAGLQRFDALPPCWQLTHARPPLQGPLQHLQHTQLDKADVFRLLQTLNTKCCVPLPEKKLQRAFNNNWEALHKDLTDLIERETLKKPTKRTRKQGATKTKGSKRDVHAGQMQKAHEQFSHDIRDNYDGIMRLLNRALTYHERNDTWRAAAMRTALRITKAHAELLIDLCMKGGLISKLHDDTYKNFSDPYVYKLTAKGISLLNRIKGR